MELILGSTRYLQSAEVGSFPTAAAAAAANLLSGACLHDAAQHAAGERMEQFQDISDQRSWSEEQHQAGKSIVLVPTMGALHAGHERLISMAQEQADRVVVSIYVNPTQFDNPDDLESYPRQLEQDLERCQALGVDAVFMPDNASMYPEGYCTFVDVVGSLQESLCAVTRPGHFRGVCTVVLKLFNIVQPQRAVFGQKDLQQVLIIQRMIGDLQVPVDIVVAPTVREGDGLAMSSRNQRLEARDRETAAAIPRGLELANRAYKAGERSSSKLMGIFADEVLAYPDVDLDYADVVNLEGFVEANEADDHCIFAVAVIINGVRLIDHIHLGGPELVAVNGE